ncbi:MAG: hypothetical protein JO352_25530 [Chloroflexi bacterium]|nr:hypothetical protein [Chloroflexota bacterium]
MLELMSPLLADHRVDGDADSDHDDVNDMMAIRLTIAMIVIASKNSTAFCAGCASIASIAGHSIASWRGSAPAHTSARC